MSELTIITNNVPRDVIDGWELSAIERAEFDYIDWKAIQAGTDSVSFFRYKGELYDLAEFLVWHELSVAESPFDGWDGYRSDSFFSGLLVRYVENFERVIVGRYYS